VQAQVQTRNLGLPNRLYGALATVDCCLPRGISNYQIRMAALVSLSGLCWKDVCYRYDLCQTVIHQIHVKKSQWLVMDGGAHQSALLHSTAVVIETTVLLCGWEMNDQSARFRQVHTQLCWLFHYFFVDFLLQRLESSALCPMTYFLLSTASPLHQQVEISMPRNPSFALRLADMMFRVYRFSVG
jgi:hypothetical protein